MLDKVVSPRLVEGVEVDQASNKLIKGSGTRVSLASLLMKRAPECGNPIKRKAKRSVEITIRLCDNECMHMKVEAVNRFHGDRHCATGLSKR
mgnify:CR=1 FL=1